MAVKKESFEFLLKKAGIRRTKKEYLLLSLGMGALLGFFIAVIFIFATLRKGFKPLPAVFIMFAIAGVVMIISFIMPRMLINKRKAEVESDLIYSVRHFLLKLDSGSALVQALEDVSSLPTVSSKYFAEVFYEIKMGTPLKQAVLKAIDYSPSVQFRSVMEKIKSSLLTGSDIKKSLKDIMDTMVEDKVLDIKKYGKKLGPATMMYMIFGTIVPSLGATMFVIATAFIGGGQYLSKVILIVMGFLLVIAQISFYFLFSQMRPRVGF
jgi:pilus assembly protein TadC